MNGPSDAWFQRRGLALLTDFYQLTMMAGHWREGRAAQRVTFDYFFRSLPPHTGFAIHAGLDPLLDFLENLRFEPDDIAYLRSLNVFDENFLDYLANFRLNCSVRAVPEGMLVFPDEPVVQVEGPVIEAQLLETAILNLLNYPILIATKAARVCLAAEGEPVLDFGLRRAHGPDGGVTGSRAAYIGGCVSTSNVLAGKVYGIPVAGTHAHSWVMSFPSELEAFRAFARQYPDRCILLVDTYDVIKSGVPNAIRVFRELAASGKNIRPAIRLDSGDLAKLSKAAYRMMIEAGLENPLIVASNDLNEDLIADLKRQGARINAWGVGTQLITSYDAPALGGVYKLTAIEGPEGWIPRMKISSNIEKATNPGRKQIIRYYDAEDRPVGDLLIQEGSPWPETGPVYGRSRKLPHLKAQLEDAVRGEPLLQTVFENGHRVIESATASRVRDRAQEQQRILGEEFKRLRNPEIYKVILSEELGEIKARLLSGNPEIF
ncbi:MAG TPA: nicotinate phosphoribosyltransferase [Candidatus Hydrogenedentes bacterium]|nr:nicotinate phosphoribosyltransferase [Candidatus Hydrogenedentota bacterium]